MKRYVSALSVAVLAAVACASVPVEVMYGKTDCYEFVALGVDVGKDIFCADGVRVTAQTQCPKVKKVHLDVFDDANGNGTYDSGETLYSQTDGAADPASTQVTTAALCGGKSTTPGGTTWHATIENENGGTTSHGGTF